FAHLAIHFKGTGRHASRSRWEASRHGMRDGLGVGFVQLALKSSVPDRWWTDQHDVSYAQGAQGRDGAFKHLPPISVPGASKHDPIRLEFCNNVKGISIAFGAVLSNLRV